MKLSALVDYLNELDKFSVPVMHGTARHDLDALVHTVVNHPEVRWDHSNRTILDSVSQIDRAYEQFGLHVGELRQRVIRQIEDLKPEYYRESMRLFEHEMPHETVDYILDRGLRMDPDSEELMRGRILRYTDWRHPGLCFRPARESWIELMVSLDPLYIVDQRPELLQTAQQRFHPQYQRRLRLYVTPEQRGQPFLALLPDEQFGYVFAFNYFNYRPMEYIHQYLVEIWNKLRPGGVVFFTFNDCDYAHGVGLAERSYQLYTPGSQILHHAKDIGYVVLDRYQGNKDVAWLELQRPGKKRSVRAGQTLAKIIARPK